MNRKRLGFHDILILNFAKWGCGLAAFEALMFFIG